LCHFEQRSTARTEQNRLTPYYRAQTPHPSNGDAAGGDCHEPAVRLPLEKENDRMIKMLIHWVVSAITLMVIAHFLHGFVVMGLQPALIAALVIGLLNATLGLVLKIITFPITILTLGLFLLVINAAMILIASRLVTGFHVTGWIPALWGAVALALVGIAVHAGSKRI
jgi:putative membrane protein